MKIAIFWFHWNYNKPTLVYKMTSHVTNASHYLKHWWFRLQTHTCVTLPQWMIYVVCVCRCRIAYMFKYPKAFTNITKRIQVTCLAMWIYLILISPAAVRNEFTDFIFTENYTRDQLNRRNDNLNCLGDVLSSTVFQVCIYWGKIPVQCNNTWQYLIFKFQQSEVRWYLCHITYTIND